MMLHDALAGKRLDQYRIIDFHVHYGKWGVMHMPSHSEAMIAKMERVGVEKLCVNAATFPDMAEGNRQVAAFVRKYPDRVVGIAALYPMTGDMVEELKRCVFDYGFRGIKLHGQMHQFPYRGLDLREVGGQWERVYELAAEYRLPILYHGVVTEADVRNFPETTFVMAHGMCGLKGRSTKERFAAYPNFYVDTPVTQNTVLEALETVQVMGTDRILWGTDAPLDDFAHRLGVILDLPISEAEKLAIFGGNARRLLGIE